MAAKQSPIPPCLTSGASSRAQHAFLVRLHSASSAQEEDEIVTLEIQRCREVLIGGLASTSTVQATLIILLQCAAIRRDCADDLSWSYVPALQLAEGGRTIQERRIGYLYLNECLPKEHELQLMLINTIRKDLSSTNEQDNLLALSAIIQLPSRDLAPAVTPLLINKKLLKHPSAAIRVRTLIALSALYLPVMARTCNGKGKQPAADEAPDFPLSMGKITRLLLKEEDPSVLCALVRLIRNLIELGLHRIQDEEERRFLAEQVLETMKEDVGRRVLAIDGVKSLRVILVGCQDVQLLENAAAGLIELYNAADGSEVFLLELCRFSAAFPHLSSLPSPIISATARLLRPDASRGTTVKPHTLPSNDHVAALRCLSELELRVWDGALGKAEMALIMSGLESADPTIRLLTLKLLQRLDPGLLESALASHLQSLRTAADLALPFHLPTDASDDMKLRAGRNETATRALEVVIVQDSCEESVRSETEQQEVRATLLFQGIQSILMAFAEGQDNGAPLQEVWESGVSKVLDLVKGEGAGFASAFTSALFATSEPVANATQTVIASSLVCEYAADWSSAEVKQGAELLLEWIGAPQPAVQELGLVAIFSLVAKSSDKPWVDEVVVTRLRQLEGGESGHISKILAIISHNLITTVLHTARSPALPDLLEAIRKVHASIPRQSGSSTSTPGIVSPGSRSKDLSKSVLRYDAYESPTPASKRSARKPEASHRGRSGIKEEEQSLFSLEDQED